MRIWELLLIAAGLSMDAFAVAICKGLSLRSLRTQDALLVGLYFGVFQAVMPLLGFLLGGTFANVIARYDHWITFVLLALIGGNMVKESREQACDCDASLHILDMLALAVATSIDALAVGVTFAFLEVSILPAVSLIGATTFALSALGVLLGHAFGLKYKSRAELFGGAVLILMGLNILLEHLGLRPW